jgi:hypothetical protein
VRLYTRNGHDFSKRIDLSRTSKGSHTRSGLQPSS